MDAPITFAVGCWGVVIGSWIVTAFSVKRTRAQQPLRPRLLYLVLTAVAAFLLIGSVRIIHWNRAILPDTVPTGILGDFLVLIGLFIALWARVTLGGDWSPRVTLKEDHELRVIRRKFASPRVHGAIKA
jgi:protein-S-isoprenylcysteine O-methyltransferase Ste14